MSVCNSDDEYFDALSTFEEKEVKEETYCEPEIYAYSNFGRLLYTYIVSISKYNYLLCATDPHQQVQYFD